MRKKKETVEEWAREEVSKIYPYDSELRDEIIKGLIAAYRKGKKEAK